MLGNVLVGIVLGTFLENLFLEPEPVLGNLFFDLSLGTLLGDLFVETLLKNLFPRTLLGSLATLQGNLFLEPLLGNLRHCSWSPCL